MPKKKPYFPNNWKAIKDADYRWFESMPVEQFFEWKIEGWEIPSSVACIIRETNISTGKVTEHVYSKASSAHKKMTSIMNKGESEFIVCDHSEVAHLYPKYIDE